MICVDTTKRGTARFSLRFNKDDSTEVIGYDVECYDSVNHTSEHHDYGLNEHSIAKAQYQAFCEIIDEV